MNVWCWTSLRVWITWLALSFWFEIVSYNKLVCVNRYMGTILGSSVISTTVLADSQLVSAAVHFQLQHRVKVNQHSLKLLLFLLANKCLLLIYHIIFSFKNSPTTVYDPVCAFWDFNLKWVPMTTDGCCDLWRRSLEKRKNIFLPGA